MYSQYKIINVTDFQNSKYVYLNKNTKVIIKSLIFIERSHYCSDMLNYLILISIIRALINKVSIIILFDRE